MYGLFLACLMGICGFPAAPLSVAADNAPPAPAEERVGSAPAPAGGEDAAAARPAVFLPGRPATSPRASQAVLSARKVSRADIAAVVQKQMGAIRRCYEAGLVEDGALSGVIEVGWKILLDGHVSSVNIVDAPRHNTALEGCLRAEIIAWKFPPTSEPVVVGAYPFVLDTTLLARRGPPPARTSPAP